MLTVSLVCSMISAVKDVIRDIRMEDLCLYIGS